MLSQGEFLVFTTVFVFVCVFVLYLLVLNSECCHRIMQRLSPAGLVFISVFVSVFAFVFELYLLFFKILFQF